MMKLIYSNFDGLDVTFQCRVPQSILAALETAKLEAQTRKRDAGAVLGERAIPVLVGESGARGGYAYRFDTGPEGETWFVSASEDPKRWNVRASAHSLGLALHGYEGMKARMLDLLDAMGAEGPSATDTTTGEISSRPVEAIGRFDFCMDIATQADFQPDMNRFLAHARCGKEMNFGEAEAIDRATMRGKRLESVTIGKMPGRQVTVYDKTREIKVKGKSYWWDLWGIDPEEFDGSVWRVEARAGKDEVRKWNIRRFADLDRMAGDVTCDILRAIRYVIPNPTDTNPTRWPNDPFWTLATDGAQFDLSSYTCKAERRKIMADFRAKIANTFRNQILGLMPGYAYAHGIEPADFQTAIDAMADDMSASARQAPEVMARKYTRTAERYVFLDGPPTYGPHIP
jgi:hypothetical protein